ncbi:MAG: FAD-binding oxidoreductase [Solirubrobacteraceae bacterium]
MRPAETTPVATERRALRGFGGGRTASVLLMRPGDIEEARTAVDACRSARRHDDRGGAIARGRGRSYGDAAQLTGGHVLEMTELRDFELDRDTGVVTASAGVTIGDLLAALAPAGWTLPVVPGTRHVTVGGAVASDIHGKNHPSAGSFGSHLSGLGLLTADGEVRELAPGGRLFHATVGGMGLTGVVLWARIRLEPATGDRMAVDTDRVRSLDDALDLLAARAPARHRIAWLDLLGPRPGRGIVTRSEPMAGEQGKAPAPAAAAALTVPEHWPAGLLRVASVRAFNELRYRRAPARERGRPHALGTHLFPLDSLGAWPRLYGRDGLIQYQFAVPVGQENVLHQAIGRLSRARIPCFLATLKALGPASGAPLSFPLAGWTLAVDIPRRAAGLEEVLDSLDLLVAEAGGRVYLTKDARLRADVVGAMYPGIEGWRDDRDAVDPDGLWRSDLALRTGLIPGGRA